MERATRIVKIVLICMLLLIVLYTVIMWIVMGHKSKIPTGFIDGLYFTSRPKAAIRLLGDPESIRDKMDLFAEVSYDFNIESDGRPVEITLVYAKDKYLYHAIMRTTAESKEEAEQLFEAWTGKMIRAYEGIDGYYCRERHTNSDTQYTQELGVNRGATGVSVTVSVVENTVEIDSWDME